jgi:WD40 repeat protein
MLKVHAKKTRVAVAAVFLLLGFAAHAQEEPKLVPQLGLGAVTSIALSPDGHLMLVGSSDDTAHLMDAATGAQIRRFVGHGGIVTSVAFSPDGRRALTSSDDQTVRLWEVATGKVIQTLKGHTFAVSGAVFSPDGRRVLTGSLDGTAMLWDGDTGQRLRTFENPEISGAITSVAISPDGRRVLTGAGTVKLWDVETGQLIRTLTGETEAGAWSVAFSPDGRRALVGSPDMKARLWDAETGKLIRTFEGHTDSVDCVAFSPDGRRVLTGSRDKTARLWDADTGLLLYTLENPTGAVDGVSFTRDGRQAVTGSLDGTVKFWDVATGRLMRRIAGHTSSILSVAFSRDGRRLLTAGRDNTTRLWDLETGAGAQRFLGHTGPVNSAIFSPDGKLVLTGSDDNTARLWDADSGRQIRSFQGPTHGFPAQGLINAVASVAFSPDGQKVLVGTADQGAKLWDAQTGEELKSWEPDTGLGITNPPALMWTENAVAFSPDGRQILLAGAGRNPTETGGSASFWDAETYELVRNFKWHDSMITSAAFSPNGRLVLTGSWDETAKLWELWEPVTGALLHSFEGPTGYVMGLTGYVNSVAISPDGMQVLAGGDDRFARLWSIPTGEQMYALEHSGSVKSVAFSPDGRFILTGSDDTTTRLWDAATGKQLATLISSDSGGWAVVDPEGRFDTSDLDGGAPLAWVVPDDPLRALPLEIFMRDYYTPRLLTSIVNGETLSPIRSIAEIKNRVQPDVSIVSASASTSQPGRADVVVHAASHVDERGQASGVQDLRLFRNGQLVGYREGALHNGDFTFSGIQLPTSSQSVTFTAYAFNSERIKSATARKDYAYQPGPPAKPRAWLLQIGENHYQASGCELHDSATDAQKLSQLLSDRLAARGLDVKPTLLVSTDQVTDATKAKIRSALAAIAASATPDDLFFLSFSGHGYSNRNGQFYILPSDFQGTCQGVEPEMLRSAISAGELAEWLRPIDAGEMTFILDSCDSASSVESNNFKPGPMGSPGLGQLAYDKRMRILAASQPNQAARESDTLGQGLLSYALTEEGLIDGKADWKPVDGKIMLGEWLNYAANVVPRILQSGAVETRRGLIPVGEPKHEVPSIQTPAVFDFSLQDTFVLQ